MASSAEAVSCKHELHRITGHCIHCGQHAVDIMLDKRPEYHKPTRESKQCPRGGVCHSDSCSFCPFPIEGNLKADNGKVRMDLLPPAAMVELLTQNPDPKNVHPEFFLLQFMREAPGLGRNSLCMAFAAMCKEEKLTLWGGLEVAAQAFQHGVGKYAEHDWMKGAKWSRYIAAALRHMTAIRTGSPHDPDSGLPHANHFLACVLILLTYSLLAIGDDDRYRPEVAGLDNASTTKNA